MKAIIGVALLALSANAFAGGRDGGINFHLRNDPRAKAEANSASISISEGGNAVAYGGSGGAGGSGGMGGIGLGGSGGVGLGGSATINEAADPANTKATVRAAPTIIAPSLNPTADCLGTASGGISVLAVGATLGKSYEAVECQRGEWYRLLNTYGHPAAAIEVACQSPIVAQTSLCKEK